MSPTRQPAVPGTRAGRLALLGLLCLFPSLAHGLEPGAEIDSLVLPAAKDSYLFLEGPRTPRHLDPAVALGLSYASGLTPVLRVPLPEGGSDIGTPVLDRTALHMAAAYGLWNRLQLGVNFRAVLEQRVERFADPRAQAAMPLAGGAGPADVGFGAKWAFVERKRVAAALAAEVSVPTGRAEALYGERGLGVTPRLTASFEQGRFAAAAMAGGRVRVREGLLPDGRPLGHEVLLALGARVRVWGPFSAIAEAQGRIAIDALERDYASGVELGVGALVQWRRGLSFVLGASSGLGLEAYGSPLLRALFAVRFTPWLGLADSDGDGIPDRRDLCPTQRAVGETQVLGCPDPDSDGDGIPDFRDACPNQPEDGLGIDDKDGCPAPDRDGDGVPDYLDTCPDRPGPLGGCPDTPDAKEPDPKEKDGPGPDGTPDGTKEE